MRSIILIGASEPIRAASALGPVPLEQPDNLVDWSRIQTVTFTLGVEGTTGAPTAWSLRAKLRFLQPHTDGIQYVNPRFFDLSAENVQHNIVEQVGFHGAGKTPPTAGGFGVVAESGDTFPVTVQRTVQHFGSMVQVVLDPQFTGGTNPGLKVSLTAVLKGA